MKTIITLGLSLGFTLGVISYAVIGFFTKGG